MDHPLLRRIATIRGHVHHRHQCDYGELQREIDVLEAEVQALLRRPCHCGRPCHAGSVPATITVTASQEGHTMSSYTAGTAVDLVADVKDDREVEVADAVTWSTDQGTITSDPADPTNPLRAQLVNAPVGTATVTATTSNGIPATDAIEFTDPNAGIPATISISDSAAPATA